MKNILLLFILFIFTQNVYASNVVVFDKSTNRVKTYLKSVNTGEYDKRDDVVINPANLPNTLIKYWKHSSGEIVEMSTVEKNTVDAEVLQNQKDAKIARINSLQISSSQLLKAITAQIQDSDSIDELKANITEDAIKQKVKSQEGLI